MAKTKEGTVTEAALVERLSADTGFSATDTRLFLRTFKQAVVDALVEGNRVSLSGLVRFEPKYVPEKRKGEMVRNPRTGEVSPRPTGLPARFKAKAFASSAIGKAFPSTRTNAGKALADRLAK